MERPLVLMFPNSTTLPLPGIWHSSPGVNSTNSTVATTTGPQSVIVLLRSGSFSLSPFLSFSLLSLSIPTPVSIRFEKLAKNWWAGALTHGPVWENFVPLHTFCESVTDATRPTTQPQTWQLPQPNSPSAVILGIIIHHFYQIKIYSFAFFFFVFILIKWIFSRSSPLLPKEVKFMFRSFPQISKRIMIWSLIIVSIWCIPITQTRFPFHFSFYRMYFMFYYFIPKFGFILL